QPVDWRSTGTALTFPRIISFLAKKMLDKRDLPCDILGSSRGVEMHAPLLVDGLFSVPASLDDLHGYSARFFFRTRHMLVTIPFSTTGSYNSLVGYHSLASWIDLVSTSPAKIYVIGIGSDGLAGVTARARDLILSAEMLLGSEETLDSIPENKAQR